MIVLLLQNAASTQPAGPGKGDPAALVTWVLVLILAVMALGVAVMVVRRKVLAKEASGADAAGLMESMRRMRDSGQITREEFDAMRRSMARKAKGESPARGNAAGGAGRLANPGLPSPDNARDVEPGNPDGA